MSDGLGKLAAIWARLWEESDPMLYAVRQANAWSKAAEALEDEAVASGAMRGEVCVMLRYTRNGSGLKMTPFLK